ncbi:MAG: hypothetical protein ACLSVD_03675 [Eggerthellaceae bacterium]
MMEARTTWNTITLPLGYLGFGAASGLSLYRCWSPARRERRGREAGGLETVIGGVLALVSGLAFGFASGAATGDAAAIFWVALVRRPRAPRVRMAGAQQARVGRDHGDRRVRRRHHRIHRVPRRHVDGGHRGGNTSASSCRRCRRGRGRPARVRRTAPTPLDQAIRNPLLMRMARSVDNGTGNQRGMQGEHHETA